MTEINHKERGHSKVGASSADRWMTCHGSVTLIEKLTNEGVVKNEESAFALEGTVAHELADYCMTTNNDPKEMLGLAFTSYSNHPIDQEMVEAVKVYQDFAATLMTPDCEVMVEEKFHLKYIDDALYGSNDLCIAQNFGTLHVIDFKYGQGIPVEAAENRQLMYYALGARYGGDFLNVVLHIVQPRCPHPAGPIRSWEVPEGRLDKFEQEIKAALRGVRSDNPKFLPTDKGCKFCDAKAYCPTIKEKALATAMVVFDDVDASPILPSVESIPVAKLGEILEVATLIKGWLKEVEAKVYHQLEHGNKVEGYKLVKGRANRKWKNETAIIEELELLGEEGCFTPPKLLSPAQLEKKVGKEFVATHTEKPDGKLSVVKESDKREAYVPAIEIFKDV